MGQNPLVAIDLTSVEKFASHLAFAASKLSCRVPPTVTLLPRWMSCVTTLPPTRPEPPTTNTCLPSKSVGSDTFETALQTDFCLLKVVFNLVRLKALELRNESRQK
jgi:hypothetical protein